MGGYEALNDPKKVVSLCRRWINILKYGLSPTRKKPSSVVQCSGRPQPLLPIKTLMKLYSIAVLLMLTALLNGAGPANSSSALSRCSSTCAPPKRCSLTAGRPTCQDSCYVDRCTRGDNCVQRQCDKTTQLQPCDPRVFCFASSTASASTSPPLPPVTTVPVEPFGSTQSIDTVTVTPAPTVWGQLPVATIDQLTPAPVTPPAPDNDSQPNVQRRCGPDNNSSSVMCDELQVCIQDGRTATSRVCMDLCTPQRCQARTVCSMRTPAACAGDRTCEKVVTCK